MMAFPPVPQRASCCGQTYPPSCEKGVSVSDPDSFDVVVVGTGFTGNLCAAPVPTSRVERARHRSRRRRWRHVVLEPVSRSPV